MPWQLCASNIGWTDAEQEQVFAAMQAAGFTGVEVAPTRLFPQDPYAHAAEGAAWAARLKAEHGFTVPSMQSIWYGRTGSIFDPEQAQELLAYTERACAFAQALGCPSLVFGCPKNRTLPAGREQDPALLARGEAFFRQAGALAARYGVRLALEANPACYTNYLTRTRDVFALVRRLGSPGLAVNLDLSTILANGERLEGFASDLALVSHVHISEPGLAPLQARPEHRRLAAMLAQGGYRGAVSIEMGAAGAQAMCRAVGLIAEVFS